MRVASARRAWVASARRARVAAAGIAAALLLAGSAGAADPGAELARAARYFQDGKAHVASFVQTFTPAGFTKSRKESGVLVVQAPENLRFDYESPKKTFAFDGKVARFYSPADRQMTVRALTEDDRAQLPLIFLESADELRKRNTLDLEQGPGAASILVTPRDPDSEVSWIRLGLAADGSPASLSFQSSAGDRTEFRFEAFRTEPPRDVSAFAIHPPAGTRIIENEP
ncbi:MAG TPA: outer membrane lipoprotein carrier protein LolA [Thermoanaerobaculia bacterium]|nr:outer membrane lipoprotein carrier protein LolA [Thermoanaerobaculia bacterium]